MVNLISRLLLASTFIGMVGCGGSSGSDTPGNTASNQETRSLTSGTGKWQHDTGTVGTTCIEQWEFESDGDYEMENIAGGAGGVATGVGLGRFDFDTGTLSGERHSLVLTVLGIEATTTCDSSPYDDREPAQNSSVTLYLDFSTADQFDVYEAASGGTNLGGFTRQ